MSAYIVIPVIVLTVLAIWFLVYMYDKRFKNPVSSVYSSRPATTCQNVRHEGLVYTISNASGSPPANTNCTPDSGVVIRTDQDGRAAPPPYGYTNQNLIVVTSIARDLPPSYDQVATTGHAPNNGPST
uniref:Uncharacterized protein n=1 Tax=Anopheles atroparvus TaxID=41427 RepID=A0AAG5DCH0_ANOAO